MLWKIVLFTRNYRDSNLADELFPHTTGAPSSNNQLPEKPQVKEIKFVKLKHLVVFFSFKRKLTFVCNEFLEIGHIRSWNQYALIPQISNEQLHTNQSKYRNEK